MPFKCMSGYELKTAFLEKALKPLSAEGLYRSNRAILSSSHRDCMSLTQLLHNLYLGQLKTATASFQFLKKNTPVYLSTHHRSIQKNL